MVLVMSNVARLRAAMAKGNLSARALMDSVLQRIESDEGEGTRAFLSVYREEALNHAGRIDRARANGDALPPMAGIPVAVKDLFDIKGEATRAGSKLLSRSPPARRDALVVARLKEAGLTIIGRTNMAEFAASAVGSNPHYGTPRNPWNRAHTPGGSSSGAAVAVADGMSVLAVGSDTVGSIRVPAALCGVVGFKPTQARVPLGGAFPYAPTLDSIGPLARSVSDCAALDAVLSGEDHAELAGRNLAGLVLAVPQGFVTQDLDAHVGAAFERACALLVAAGARLPSVRISELDEVRESGITATIQFAEAYAIHERQLFEHGSDYDPHVRGRLLQGKDISAAQYLHALQLRQTLIERIDQVTNPFDALLMPTVPIIAPTIAACEGQDAAIRSTLIRNTAPFNVVDRCAISLPMSDIGEPPAGLMLVGARGADRTLFKIALAVERALARARPEN